MRNAKPPLAMRRATEEAAWRMRPLQSGARPGAGSWWRRQWRRMGGWLKNGGALQLGILAATVTSGRPAAAAAGIDSLNNLQALLLNLVTALGAIFIVFGIVSFAISLQSHDDSQRSRALMSLVGGCLAVGVRVVLDTLGVTHQ